MHLLTKTSVQNNATIREIRRQVKEKLSEVEDIILDNMSVVRTAVVKEHYNEVERQKRKVADLELLIKKLQNENYKKQSKLEQLEKENLELQKFKAVIPSRKYSVDEIKLTVTATLVEINRTLNQIETPIIPLDKMGMFIYRVCEDPNSMVPSTFRNYWGKG